MFNPQELRTLKDYIDSSENQNKKNKVEQAIKNLDKIQVDIDYDVGLQQVYSYWKQNSILVLNSNIGVVDVPNYYLNAIINSGLFELCKVTQLDKIVLSKLNGVTVKRYEVKLKEDNDELLDVFLHLSLNFLPNTFVKEAEITARVIVGNTNEVVESMINFNKKGGLKTKDGFFKELEDQEILFMFVNRVLPYSYDFYNKNLPPVLLDDIEIQQ
ncbi:Nucleosome assembly protein [Entamoeba marina]